MEKQRREKSERRREEERRSEKRKRQKTEDAGAEKVAKPRNTERWVRSHLARWEMKSCTPLWREAHFEVKMHKTSQVRSTFGSCDVEKAYTIVARSTFPSQKCKKTAGYGSLLDVQMSFRVARARHCAPCHKRAKLEGFAAVSTRLHYTPLHYITLQLQLQLQVQLQLQLQLHCTTLH